MLDEFAQLGRMEIIEDNYALMRGYGVKLMDDLARLKSGKKSYNERWESFISNAGIVQAFAPQDMTTRKYLSDLADERLTWHTRAADREAFPFKRWNRSSDGGVAKRHPRQGTDYVSLRTREIGARPERHVHATRRGASGVFSRRVADARCLRHDGRSCDLPSLTRATGIASRLL